MMNTIENATIPPLEYVKHPLTEAGETRVDRSAELLQFPIFDENENPVNYQGVIHDQNSLDTYFTQNRNSHAPYNESEFYEVNKLVKGMSINSES